MCIMEEIIELILKMKIVNKTKNTIYIQDLDEYLPYQDEEPFYISPEKLKKSHSLRSLILTKTLEVLEYDENERIEASLIYLLKKQESKSTISEEEEKEEFVTPTENVEIKIHGLFYDTSGYAKVNRNLAIQLHNMGYTIKVDPKRGQNQLSEDELKEFVPLEKTKISRNHISIDSIVPSLGELSSGKYKILYTTIESYSVPQQFIDSCQNYDEIWTISEWNTRILKKHVKNKPIYTIATGIDPELYCEEGPQFNFESHVKNFVFVSVFTWTYRKGYDVLLRAYFDEFSADDDVTLLIMSRYQSGQSKYQKDKIKNDINEIMKEFPNKDMPQVVRYSQVISEQDMPKLYRAANAFILCTRGEGNGLPPLEASMCGLPIIMTNCSGQQQYLREDNSYPIEIDRIVKAQPGQFKIHYWDNQKFPALTSQKVHNQTRQLMRHVYENYNEAKEKNRKMQQLIRGKFTWRHTATRAAKRINEIQKQLEGAK